MKPRVKTEIRAHGVRALLARHPAVRKLKHQYIPSTHGNRIWGSSWVLMDYIGRRKPPGPLKVMEVGCGWGLAGIYCARKLHARVKAVDTDPEILPYLALHAKVNGVEIEFVKGAFGGLKAQALQDIDLLIGADICFWDNMVLSLKRLINRALKSGVPMILIADPGRSPFHQLCEYYVGRKLGFAFDWTTRRPRHIQGRILRIGML